VASITCPIWIFRADLASGVSHACTIRTRAFSSVTELKIGSNANRGSLGKYICVTIRDRNEWPNTEK
jgi:hypothetical protein